MRDAADPDRFVESWWEGSWLDHQRQHARVSNEDAKVQERIRGVLKDGTAPEVVHLVSPPVPA